MPDRIMTERARAGSPVGSAMVALFAVYSLAAWLACASSEDGPSPEELAPSSVEEEPDVDTAHEEVASSRAPQLPASISEARRVAEAQAALPRPFFEDPRLEPYEGLTVAPGGGPALRALKDAALTLVDRALPEAIATPSPEATLRAAFAEGGVVVSSPDDEAWRERAISLSVAALKDHRDRWLVTVCVLLAPGSDCVVAVYTSIPAAGESARVEVRRTLVSRNDEYATSMGARLLLGVAVSPTNDAGDFYVVVVHTHPWISSCWRDLELVVLAPSGDPANPTRLAAQSDYAYWCSGVRLEVAEDTFSVGYERNWAPRSAGLLERVSVWRRVGRRFRLASTKDVPRVD